MYKEQSEPKARDFSLPDEYVFNLRTWRSEDGFFDEAPFKRKPLRGPKPCVRG